MTSKHVYASNMINLSSIQAIYESEQKQNQDAHVLT